MRVAGDAVLHAEPARAYAALSDPVVLVRTIPGCGSASRQGDGRYRVSMTTRVASLEDSYDAEVELVEHEQDRFVLSARGSGGSGTVDATVRVRLEPAEDGCTRVAYEADAAVGGKLGGVGRRLLESAAYSLVADTLTALDRELAGPPVGTVLSEPDTAMAVQGSDKTVMGAVGAGVAAAFGLGWWLGRRSRR